MVIVIVVKDDDPVQLRMDDIYDHSFVSTIQHHVHHISNRIKGMTWKGDSSHREPSGRYGLESRCPENAVFLVCVIYHFQVF
jgi:hypothetical protein